MGQGCVNPVLYAGGPQTHVTDFILKKMTTHGNRILQELFFSICRELSSDLVRQRPGMYSPRASASRRCCVGNLHSSSFLGLRHGRDMRLTLFTRPLRRVLFLRGPSQVLRNRFCGPGWSLYSRDVPRVADAILLPPPFRPRSFSAASDVLGVSGFDALLSALWRCPGVARAVEQQLYHVMRFN